MDYLVSRENDTSPGYVGVGQVTLEENIRSMTELHKHNAIWVQRIVLELFLRASGLGGSNEDIGDFYYQAFLGKAVPENDIAIACSRSVFEANQNTDGHFGGNSNYILKGPLSLKNCQGFTEESAQ